MIQALNARPAALAPANSNKRPALPRSVTASPAVAAPFFGGGTRALAPGLRAPRAARAGLQCQALDISPVLQALPAIGGAAAGAVVGVPAAIIAAVVTSGLSKLVDGSLHKDDKLSLAAFGATVGVEAVVLMAHMTLGAVVSCAIVGRPIL